MRNFYPRSPCGGRLTAFFSVAMAANFYPRSPCGERLFCGLMRLYSCLFLSTLSLRRATGCWPRRARPSCYFYPRSPCGERPRQICQAENQSPFLSTLSLRRATHYRRNADRNTRFLSTLSLRRATALRHVHRIKAHISIHALLAESDAWPVASYATGQIFLSTLSLRRATLPL